MRPAAVSCMSEALSSLLASDHHHELREMLSQLRHHRGDVRRAGRVDDEHARLQLRQLLGHVIEIGRSSDRRTAGTGLLHGLHQIRVPAENQDRRLMPLGGSWPKVLRVVDFEVDLVRTARGT